MTDAETKLDQLRDDVRDEASKTKEDCMSIKKRIENIRDLLDSLDYSVNEILSGASEIEGKAKDE